MKNYDVIIIGAGIAGCGLAYNLKRFGYKGKILIIDRSRVGSNAAYGYKATFKKVIDEYNLPYDHKFDGVNLCTSDKIAATIDLDFYFLDYIKICSFLLQASDAEFIKEKAIDFNNEILTTNISKYKFRYLIDCSGYDSFIKKKLNKKLPSLYYLGIVKAFETTNSSNDNHFYYFLDEQGNGADIYFFKNKVLYGDWLFSDKIDFSLIKPFTQSVVDIDFSNLKQLSMQRVIIPLSPALPLTNKNIAFLGDSFGNATTSTAEGVAPILESSKILAQAIIKKDLKYFSREWKKRYLNDYIKHLALKTNFKERMQLFESLSSRPDILIKLSKNEKVSLPREVIRKIPKNIIYKGLLNYLKLKLKYFLEGLKK